jgi:hypothetical protein
MSEPLFNQLSPLNLIFIPKLGNVLAKVSELNYVQIMIFSTV